MISGEEIERKFLIQTDDYKKEAYAKNHIVQGFLSRDPDRTVRIRLKNGQGYLTVKGRSNKSGTSRMEWEYPIEEADALGLLKLCLEPLIEKFRYLVKSGTHVVEVDEFQGQNLGLVVAEVELNAEEERFTKPVWLGKEVTGDPKYYNAQLSKIPFIQWK
jgi:CYTH domain-containing protein